MNIKDFKWTEKRFGTTFANILKKLGGLSKDATDGSIEYKDDQGNVTKLVTDATFSSLLAKNGLIEVKWQELKDKRDNSELIPGSLYRITDYNCTTTQENTQSAGHQFDIVLLALSKNKLAEEGWAMMHDNIYDVTFADGVTKKCYIYNASNGMCYLVDIYTLLGDDSQVVDDTLIINEENKTATCDSVSTVLDVENLPYNYFQSSNLSAWKVWYCLDNDKDRFAWADDSVDEDSPASLTNDRGDIFVRNTEADTKDGKNNPLYAWSYDSDTYYTYSEQPEVGDYIYAINKGEVLQAYSVGSYTPAHEGTGLPNGRGVIYRLIDEFNNDIKYDFKNIQFKRTITDGQYDENGTETWCYTLNIWYNDMCQDASIVGNTLPNNEGFIIGVYDNNFGHATAYNLYLREVNTFAFALGNNVVLSFDERGEYYGIYSNTIGNEFYSNTIGNYFHGNTIGNYFFNNMIGGEFFFNIIGNYFVNQTISGSFVIKNYGNNGVELATKADLQ